MCKKLLLFLLAGLLLAGCALAEQTESRLILPAGIQTVEEQTFCGDTSLETVELPDGVERIESQAFAFSSLRKLNLPASLKWIAEDALEGCAEGLELTVDEKSYAFSWAREHGFFPAYTALLIGEVHCRGRGKADRNRQDAENMAAMLRSVKTPSGTKYQTTVKTDLSYSGVRNAIRETFGGMQPQDVCLLFVATHGNSKGDGGLYTTDSTISFSDLASWLNADVKGKAIVILESCGAGSAIYDEEGLLTGGITLFPNGETEEEDPEAFLQKAIDAFAAFGGGALRSGKGLVPNSTGDLRVENKFYVLAAAEHHEQSWGWEAYTEDGKEFPAGNFFTSWLLEGIGADQKAAPADHEPSDGILTLRELYTYVSQYNDFELDVDGTIYYQHVQSYPETEPGCSYPLFVH